jgi:hypothetical protein
VTASGSVSVGDEVSLDATAPVATAP